MEILASGKTGANKYDLLENDPLKVLTRLDARQLAEALQYLSEVTQGYSLSGDEGSSDALVTDLSIIDTTNITTYKPKLTQALQTLIAHQNTLDVDGTTTANAIVLIPKKISADAAPNAVDYTIVAPLPLKWQDDLQFTFRATITNTTATTLSIPSLSGLSGAVDLLDESEAALVGGEITIGKYVTVATKTITGNKKFILRKALLTQATETSSGGAELATQSEADAGTDDLRFITPLKLKTRQGVRYVGRLTASSTTTLGQSLSTGKKYLFRFNNILPSVNATFLTAQYSTDGGSTLLSASYKNGNAWQTTSDALAGVTGKTSGLTIAGNDGDVNTGCGNTANKGGVNGWFIIDDPSQATTYKQSNWKSTFYNSTSFNYFSNQSGGGVYEGGATAINYIGFTFKAVNSNTTSGVIVSGSIDVWEINA